MTLFLVRASFGSWDGIWLKTVGLFSTIELANNAVQKQIEHIEAIKNTPNPVEEIKDDEFPKDIDEESKTKWFKWYDKQNDAFSFNKCFIEEIEVDKIDITI